MPWSCLKANLSVGSESLAIVLKLMGAEVGLPAFGKPTSEISTLQKEEGLFVDGHHRDIDKAQ